MKNKVQLMGHLGNHPEVKRLEGGKIVVKFSLATNEVYKNQSGEKVTDTQWHNLVAWGRTAENIEKLLKKGSEVLVEGKLNSHSFEDTAGTKKYVTEVLIHEFMLLDKKNQ